MNEIKMSNFSRTNSICPSPEESLLDAVEKNDIESIKNLLNSYIELLQHKYPYKYETILLLACSKVSTSPETLQTLIDVGASIEEKCIHKAAQNPNVVILETIVRNLKHKQQLESLINNLLDGNNALHSLIKSDIIKSNENSFVRHVELLLEAGIDINQGDTKNLSAIYWAARYKLKEIVKIILHKSGNRVDIDTHQLRGVNARKLIIDNNLYDGLLPSNQVVYNVKDQLFKFIKDNNEKDFIDLMNRYPEFVNENNTEMTLLQMSCNRGLSEIVHCLIDNGVDINGITEKNQDFPIELASVHGYYKIFKMLLEDPKTMIPSSILNNLFKKDYIYEDKNLGRSHAECSKLILEKIEGKSDVIDLNEKDNFANTPMHYAVKYTNPDTICLLLQKGGSLACKNIFNKMPIEDIEPEVLEKHLDDCIQFESEQNCERPEFQVVFDYRSLVLPKSIKESPELGKISSSDIVSETEVIGYMSRTPEFKPLLMHPVIISFLLMKWHHIRGIFYTNLAFYIIFVSSLFGYIFSYYANFDTESQLPGWTKIFLIVLYVTFILLILRELFQILISLKNYAKNFDNWVEIALIITTGMILLTVDPSDNTRKQLSSIALLLAAFALILMLGQHPQFSTNVVMFKTVSITFFKLLLWYSLLVIAFALSFYILFTKSEENSSDNSVNTNKTDNEQDEDFFTGPGKSLFKTIVMLTGEFDASSIDFNTFPYVSKAIFALFVFTITIILLNLLNGLAVSDTQAIKDNAELVGHIARAQHIQYVESMCLGNILPISLINFMKSLCCCIPDASIHNNYNLLKPLVKKRVCLFVNEANERTDTSVLVFPNDYGRISMMGHGKFSKNCVGNCSALYLNKEATKRTKQLIMKKRREELEKRKELSLEFVWQRICNIEQKMDELLRCVALNNNKED